MSTPLDLRGALDELARDIIDGLQGRRVGDGETATFEMPETKDKIAAFKALLEYEKLIARDNRGKKGKGNGFEQYRKNIDAANGLGARGSGSPDGIGGATPPVASGGSA